MFTFSGKGVRNGTKVQNITLVLYGEHPELNEDGMCTPVNLGNFSVELTPYGVDFSEHMEHDLIRAAKSILLTYLLKQSERSKQL